MVCFQECETPTASTDTSLQWHGCRRIERFGLSRTLALHLSLGRLYSQSVTPVSEPKQVTLWQRFKRWTLVARIGALGRGGLIALFGLNLLLGLVLHVADPNGMEEIRAAQ
jgi:hypothetical protein